MPTFTLNEPIETREPVIEVDALPRIGRYIFELVVVDAGGGRSAPVRATVTVRRAVGPPGDAAPVQKPRRARKPKAEAAAGTPPEKPAEKPAEKPQRKPRKKPRKKPPAAKAGGAAP